MAFDEDWNQVGLATFWTGTFLDSSYVHIRGPSGDTLEVEGPDPNQAFEDRKRERTLGAAYKWEGSGNGSLLGYMAVLTSDDDPVVNVTMEGDGWLGNRSAGDDVQYTRVRDFDQVRFHGKVDRLGPSLTLDAQEHVSVQDGMLGAMDLTPGGGEAGYFGPGDGGYHCDQTLDRYCNHWNGFAGPPGGYDFVIDRNLQVADEREPWVLLAHAGKP
jgi:hypothetical protein